MQRFYHENTERRTKQDRKQKKKEFSSNWNFFRQEKSKVNKTRRERERRAQHSWAKRNTTRAFREREPEKTATQQTAGGYRDAYTQTEAKTQEKKANQKKKPVVFLSFASRLHESSHIFPIWKSTAKQKKRESFLIAIGPRHQSPHRQFFIGLFSDSFRIQCEFFPEDTVRHSPSVLCVENRRP